MSEQRNFFKKDNYAFGSFLGLISPAALLAIIHYSGVFIAEMNHFTSFDASRYYPFSLLLNIIFIRYYLVNAKLIKTGSSIVAVTFFIVLLYFFFIGRA